MKGRNCCIDRSRRDFLLKSAGGLGALSLLDLFGAQAQPGAGATSAGVLGTGQLPARAKRVICLHMLGAISHVDTFDYKPTLTRMHGQDLPPSVRETTGEARGVSRATSVGR